MVPGAVVEPLPAVEADEPAPPAAPVATGGPASAGDSSSSRDRLVRIAAMIRDADHVPSAPGRRRPQRARLIPLTPLRDRARTEAGTALDVAS